MQTRKITELDYLCALRLSGGEGGVLALDLACMWLLLGVEIHGDHIISVLDFRVCILKLRHNYPFHFTAQSIHKCSNKITHEMYHITYQLPSIPYCMVTFQHSVKEWNGVQHIMWKVMPGLVQITYTVTL